MGSLPAQALTLRGPRQIAVCLGALLSFSLIGLGAMGGTGCGLVHVHPDAHPGRLSDAENAVQIFFKDQKLPCDEVKDLGHIQAASGEELEHDEEQEEYATFDAAIAWLKKAANKRGANAVVVIDRKVSKDQTTYLVTGTAIRCTVNKENQPPPPPTSESM